MASRTFAPVQECVWSHETSSRHYYDVDTKHDFPNVIQWVFIFSSFSLILLCYVFSVVLFCVLFWQIGILDKALLWAY